jgi:hypothetical protein
VRIEPRTYSADASVDHKSITPKRATTSLAASVDPTEARKVVLPARPFRLHETPWPSDEVRAGASIGGNHLSIPFTA